MAKPEQIILASGSAARRSMLMASGVPFEVLPADINEAQIRRALMGESDYAEAADVAGVLAMEKALLVSRAHPKAYVIGSDQVLAQGRRMFSKTSSLDEARRVLRQLRGSTHELVSAVALARGGDVLWQTFDSAQMTMRNFSDVFLETYLAQAGNAILKSVGCYELEGFGIQLFERIEGDYFTILGMPLLPLLTELRTRDLVAA